MNFIFGITLLAWFSLALELLSIVIVAAKFQPTFIRTFKNTFDSLTAHKFSISSKLIFPFTKSNEPIKSTNRLMKYNKQQKDWPNFFLKVSLTVNYSDFGACFLRVKTRTVLLTFFLRY